MSLFTVVIGWERPLRFADPQRVLRATDATRTALALDEAEAALRDGAWIAGAIDYEGGAVIGLFDEPQIDEAPREARGFSVGGARSAVTVAAYDAAISEIRRSIYEGDVYQVNYTIPYDFRFDGDPYELYLALARRAEVPHAAYLCDGDRHIVSLSPELFLGFDGLRVKTKPMKGTALLDRISELDSEKNRAEHVMIVDLLRNDLHRVCSDVTVERLFEVECYPTFATMTSTIAGSLNHGRSLAELFAATFPCGSITGAPKRAAMARIAQLEPRARGAYCGTVGYLSPQRRGWWNVAIRTAQIDLATGSGRFDAGGGIVADSVAAEERNEVALKARFFLDATTSIEAIETFAGGDPQAREMHLRRMERTAAYLGAHFDLDRLIEAIAAIDRPGHLIRVQLREDGTPVVELRPLVIPGEPVRIALSPERVRSSDPLLRHKTTWRPAYDRAAAFAVRHDCFDALLRNERDEITEGARTTLFARIDGRLFTPASKAGLLPGILRARLLTDGVAEERILRAPDLRGAEEIFIGNSGRGMLRAHFVETVNDER